MMLYTPISILGLVTAVLSETIDVKVGDGGLIFEPNSVTAQIGDSVRFQFYSGTGSHSVALSAFDTPCQPAENGFYSGIIQGNREGDHTFTINITSTSPQWYYCSVGSHCPSGMVGVINPPAASPSNEGQDITAYASAAQGVLRQTPPGEVGGGVVATDDSSSPSSSASESGGLTPASPRPSLVASTTTTGGGETATSSVVSTSGGSTGPMSTTMSGSGSGSGSTSGASTTSAPTGTGTGTEAGASETATTTSGGRRSEWSVVLWLTVILGGLVALMS